MDAISRVVDRVLGTLASVIFAVLVVVVTWQIVARQILKVPAAWTEESARYLFVILAMLAAALVFSERGHIAVEMLVNKFPRRVQKVIAVLVELIVIVFATYVLVLGGLRVSQNAWGQALSAVPMTVGQAYLVLPVAGVLITFYAVCHLIRLARGTTEVLPETVDAALDV